MSVNCGHSAHKTAYLNIFVLFLDNILKSETTFCYIFLPPLCSVLFQVSKMDDGSIATKIKILNTTISSDEV